MADAAQQLFAPDPALMAEHVEHLFGGYLSGCHDGLVELAWTDPVTHALRHGEMFGTDRLDELVAKAAALNAQPGCNVYIGAALRKPETAPFGRASDADFFALTGAYADLDEPGAATAAKDKYGTTKPTKVVVTGSVPHPRAQLWWRLEEPITDPRLSEGLLKGVAGALDGDPTVVNPSRVMRLAGGVAWPVKDQRVTEATQLVTPSVPPLPPSAYSWESLARRFPPAQPGRNEEDIVLPGIAGAAGVTREATLFGLPGKVVNGREAYARSTIAACLVQLLAETGATPSPQALFDLAWPQFSRICDVSRPRKNGEPWTPEAFAQKVTYTLKRFAEGKIRGARTPDEAKAVHAQKQAAHEARGGKGRYTDFGQVPPQHDPGQPAEAIPLVSAFPINGTAIPVRNWVVINVLLKGSVSMLIAPPGSGKSLFTLQLGIAIAANLSWGGWAPRRPEKVLILNSEDDPDEMDRRLFAAATEMGVDQGKLAGRVLMPKKEVLSSMVVSTFDARTKTVVRTPFVDRLVETIKANDIGVLVIDPFAETFDVDENSNSQVKWAVIQWREIARLTGCSLLLVHHTKKYSSDMAGEADAGRGGGSMIGVARVMATLFTMTEEEAEAMNVAPEDRHSFVRFDDAKQNYALKGVARWFQKKTIKLPNGTAFDPADEVGVLAAWTPPGALDGVSMHDINLALDAIDRGVLAEDGRPTGQFFTASVTTAQRDRWAGNKLMTLLNCTEQAAKNLIRNWLKTNVLETFDYDDPIQRKPRKGVRSIPQNRPGTKVSG